MFKRRHHCRQSGGIYIDRACNYYVTLPDLGCYQPVRIYDNLIGLPSTELLEDIMFLSDRKTEFAATLKSMCTKGTQVKFVNGAMMGAGPVPQMSLCLSKGEICFISGSVVKRDGVGGQVGEGGAFDATLRYDKGSQRYVVTVPRDGGIDDDVLERRMERMRKAQKKVEKRRRKEREARAAANALREEKRERERHERLEKKRAAKRAEKEAKEREAEVGDGGGEERVKAMVRRTSAGKKQFGGGGGRGEDRGGGLGGGDQMTELQKAMARRRAKNGGAY